MTESNETSSLTPDWVQFYQRNVQPQSTIFNAANDRSSFPPAGGTATAAVSSPSSPPPSSHGLSPEGRVAKPVRRRPRASRRTPTTVFNTDSSNFRAMVQQFTGGGLALLPPPSPFSFSAGSGLGFRLGPQQQQLENLNIPPQRAASNYISMMFEQQQAYNGDRYHHHHQQLQQQPFLDRVSFPPPPHHGGGHGGSSSSGNDQNSRTETNYML